MDTDIFSRQDAKHAKGRLFAQSEDDDWATPKGFKRDVFWFVVVSRQINKEILCVNGRKSAVKYTPNGRTYARRA